MDEVALFPETAPPLARRAPAALYVHIPFCLKKCPYCDFAVASKGPGLERRYLDALEIEARARIPHGFQPRTIFVGGGTPTELSQGGLERLGAILEASGVERSRLREFTVEANPGTLAGTKLATLVAIGVTRVSLGAQSFDPAHLKTLGRTHTPEDIAWSVRALRDAGIKDVSLDLIFGVPGQTETDLERDLERALALEPDHVSTYGLTYEPGTELTASRKKGLVRAASERLDARFYALIRKRLRAAGFRHYEISNFAKPGHVCAHNRVYWRNGAYVALGNSAVAHRRGVRIANIRDAGAYMDAVLTRGGLAAVASRERLAPERKARESAVLALRTGRGISRARFQKDLGVDPLVVFAPELAKLAALGLVRVDESGVRLAGRGVAVADRIAVELL